MNLNKFTFEDILENLKKEYPKANIVLVSQTLKRFKNQTFKKISDFVESLYLKDITESTYLAMSEGIRLMRISGLLKENKVMTNYTKNELDYHVQDSLTEFEKFEIAVTPLINSQNWQGIAGLLNLKFSLIKRLYDFTEDTESFISELHDAYLQSNISNEGSDVILNMEESFNSLKQSGTLELKEGSRVCLAETGEFGTVKSLREGVLVDWDYGDTSFANPNEILIADETQNSGIFLEDDLSYSEYKENVLNALKTSIINDFSNDSDSENYYSMCWEAFIQEIPVPEEAENIIQTCFEDEVAVETCIALCKPCFKVPFVEYVDTCSLDSFENYDYATEEDVFNASVEDEEVKQLALLVQAITSLLSQTIPNVFVLDENKKINKKVSKRLLENYMSSCGIKESDLHEADSSQIELIDFDLVEETPYITYSQNGEEQSLSGDDLIEKLSSFLEEEGVLNYSYTTDTIDHTGEHVQKEYSGTYESFEDWASTTYYHQQEKIIRNFLSSKFLTENVKEFESEEVLYKKLHEYKDQLGLSTVELREMDYESKQYFSNLLESNKQLLLGAENSPRTLKYFLMELLSENKIPSDLLTAWELDSFIQSLLQKTKEKSEIESQIREYLTMNIEEITAKYLTGDIMEEISKELIKEEMSTADMSVTEKPLRYSVSEEEKSIFESIVRSKGAKLLKLQGSLTESKRDDVLIAQIQKGPKIKKVTYTDGKELPFATGKRSYQYLENLIDSEF